MDATTLAQEIKARHVKCEEAHGICCLSCYDPAGYLLNWPCDAVRAADMLLELARAEAHLRNVWNTVPAEFDGPDAERHARALNDAGRLIAAIDAARNATQQEKP